SLHVRVHVPGQQRIDHVGAHRRQLRADQRQRQTHGGAPLAAYAWPVDGMAGHGRGWHGWAKLPLQGTSKNSPICSIAIVGGAEAPTGNAARHYLSRIIWLIAASAAPTGDLEKPANRENGVPAHGEVSNHRPEVS